MKVAATLTYYCLITNENVTEEYATRKEARQRAVWLSSKQLAKNIRVINHA